MNITKRNGMLESYNPAKIVNAIKGAFGDTGKHIPAQGFDKLLALVEAAMNHRGVSDVEAIQDIVEEVLMKEGFYAEAKSYILYRAHRTTLREVRLSLLQGVDDKTLEPCLIGIQRDFPEESYSLTSLLAKFNGFLKPDMTSEERYDALIRSAVELTSQESPRWEYIAARILSHHFHSQLAIECEKRGFDSFYEKLRYLCDQGLYGSYILDSYSK